MHTTSVSLLERLRRPTDAQAWARFVALYTPLLLYWARKAGLAQQDAADLVQDVFTLLVQKLPEFTYDKGKSFRGWLRTVVLNKWRDRARRRSVPVVDAGEADLSELDVPDGLAEFWDAEHRQRLVARGLEIMQAEFQPTTWKACWEHVAQGRPAAEVAAELGISENAVYIARSRVLRRLREELDGLLD
jgi:RNA polymerase sigma-70 factor (ECF subfamily)